MGFADELRNVNPKQRIYDLAEEEVRIFKNQCYEAARTGSHSFINYYAGDPRKLEPYHDEGWDYVGLSYDLSLDDFSIDELNLLKTFIYEKLSKESFSTLDVQLVQGYNARWKPTAIILDGYRCEYNNTYKIGISASW